MNAFNHSIKAKLLIRSDKFPHFPLCNQKPLVSYCLRNLTQLLLIYDYFLSSSTETFTKVLSTIMETIHQATPEKYTAIVIGGGLVSNTHFFCSNTLWKTLIFQVGALCVCLLAERGYKVTLYEKRSGKFLF